MNDPIQLLLLGLHLPDLITSAYGPFVEHPVQSLDEIGLALSQQPYDAVVLSLDQPAVLVSWVGLSRTVLDAAVVVVAPEPEVAEAIRLMRLGVQDVLSRREAAVAGTVARVVRLAVERKRIERAARKAYATDLASGLPNHAQLMEHMTHLLALREREPAAMALLAVRVEGLQTVAARFGDESAQVLRRKAAVRLRAGLRASDVVAALGNDTFAVLLAWIDDPANATQVADKLAASLQRPFSVAGQDLALAVSVGVSRYPDDGKSAEVLLRQAQQQASAPATGRVGFANVVERGIVAAANDDEG
ncbi:MAG: GGDEF domain-containing protein [Ideonella sp.]|nr:GGDEF domain-containing protein [Ideonella sp.]MBL0148107.1 GGDEF domain-containing protein [Ideonella sp.]